MDNKARRDATVMVWIGAVLGGMFFNTPFAPALPLTIATAILTTILLWGWVVIKPVWRRLASATSKKPPQTEVNNTAYKLAVLMEMMDEHERDEFKYQLKNNLLAGDDSMSIESLIAEKRKRG
jgi:1,4-dihydroxy-2-naphthoate octaprenyltransferase